MFLNNTIVKTTMSYQMMEGQSAPAPNTNEYMNIGALTKFINEKNLRHCTVLNDSNSRASQPDQIKLPLKEHQLTLVKKCQELENSIKTPIKQSYENKKWSIQSQFGIIGDIVGSGKTLSVLSLICSKPVLKISQNKSFRSNGLMTITTEIQPEEVYLGYNIIVVPHTITSQWENALSNHCSLKFICVKNKKTYDIFCKEFDTDEDNDYQIVLISSTKYRAMCDLALKKWDTYKFKYSRIFFDEADTLKIPACGTINTSFVWFITSTYLNLVFPSGQHVYTNHSQTRFSLTYESSYSNIADPCRFRHKYSNGLHHTGFIRNTVNFLDVNYIKYITLKNDDDFVKSSFRLPEIIMEIIKCKIPLSLSVLNNNVSSNIIEHINGGDIKGAIELVNCTKVSEKDLIEGATMELTKQLANKKIEFDMKSQMTYSSENAKKESLTKIKIAISNIENKINSIKEKLQESNTCTICYDDLLNDTITPCCKSKFCFECISTWLMGGNNTCPFCRHKVSLNSLTVVSEHTNVGAPAPKKDELLSKNDNLDILIKRSLEKETPVKMLIFSDYSNSFDSIVNILNNNNLKYSMIKGSGSKINNVVSNFKLNEGPNKIDVLMLNADFCAAGINLENATDIVFYHMMSSTKTTQIIGRGQRPGRKSPLNVWKLCYENEIPV